MAIRFDKFTVKAQEAVQRAQGIAQEHGHQQLDPIHLFAALLAEEQGIVSGLLNKIGTNLPQLKQMVDSELRHIPKVSGGDGQLHLTSSINHILEAAQEAARQM